jgi:stearoyl-CoA desaturase (delta-9 desaturase)
LKNFFLKHARSGQLNWAATLFLIFMPFIAIVGSIYAIELEGFSWAPWVWAFIFYYVTVMAISGGYHRLYSHRAFKANKFTELMYLLWGAASFEFSVLEWARKHRRHHAKVDTVDDPYDINGGFWWAHMGWMMVKEDPKYQTGYPKDLLNNKLVMWQHKNYNMIALVMCFMLPTAIGFFYDLPISFFFIASLLRIIFVHHVTYFINSLCHMVGTRPYTEENSARDSHILALLTCGEGYHNYHHKFQSDYRNGPMWHNYDPSKWFIYFLSLFGFTYDLKAMPSSEIRKAMLKKQKLSVLDKLKAKNIDTSALEQMYEKAQEAQKKFYALKKEYKLKKKELTLEGEQKLAQMKANIKQAKMELKEAYNEFKESLRNLSIQAQMA